MVTIKILQFYFNIDPLNGADGYGYGADSDECDGGDEVDERLVLAAVVEMVGLFVALAPPQQFEHFVAAAVVAVVASYEHIELVVAAGDIVAFVV